jgi:alpha-glucosidase
LFARRKGSTWFLAAMCGPGAKTIQVPLSFLSAGQYESTLVRDDARDGSTVVVESAVYTQKGTITLELRPGGGFVGQFASVPGR